MHICRYLTLSLFLFVALFAQAQKKKTDELLEEGLGYFEYEQYQEAVDTYGKVDTAALTSAQHLYAYGVSLLLSNHSELALWPLTQAANLDYTIEEKPYLDYDPYHAKYVSSDLDFNLARAYHLHLKFDKAVKHYNNFKMKFYATYKKKVDNHQQEIEAIDHLILQAKNGKTLMKSPVKGVVLENLGPTVNTEYEEIVPLISADENNLIFTSRRPNTTGGAIDPTDEKFMEDIYMTKKRNGNWRKPWKISKKINTDEHDACIGLSPNGNQLLIYKNNHHHTGDIYLSELKGRLWSAPEKLPDGINSRHTENSASLSADNRMIIFTSDRPGDSFGRGDLWMAFRQPDGTWGEPQNLGPEINTPYNEDAPFIHPDGKTLYFSSKGHNSMGGYDIFVSTFDPNTKNFSKPKNMGYPINSPFDDIFFVWSPDGKRAYFSSHHEDSYGDQDIYMLTYPDATMSVVLVKGTVKAKLSQDPLRALILTENNLSKKEVHRQFSLEESGEFVMILEPGKQYSITFEKDGYLTHTEHISFPDIGKYYEKELYVELDLFRDGSVTVLNNVFFENNKADLLETSFLELDKFIELLKSKPEVDAEIAGHTEIGSTAEWNEELSTMRAQAVVDYMVAKGISKRRLRAIGYGAQFPRTNDKSTEGKRMNRRTEIILHNRADEGKNWDPFYE